MIRAWLRFWFADGPIHVLGIVRVVMVLNALLLQVLPAVRMLPFFAIRPTALSHPTGFHSFFGLPWPPDPGWTMVIGGLALISGATACLGLATRISLVIFAGCFGYLAGGLSSLGVVDHATVLTFHVLLVLIVAPGATAWSLDALWAWRRARGPLLPALRGPAGSRWGVQLLLVLLSAVYVLSGIAKLRWGGLGWADGNTLGWYLSGQATMEWVPMLAGHGVDAATAWRDGIGLQDHAYSSHASVIARWIAAHPPLPMLLSLGALGFELGAWLMLIPRLRNWVLLPAVIFHATIGQLMAHSFFDWQLLCLLLVDWPAAIRALDMVLRRIWPQSAEPGQITVLYDGLCGLCDATVAWALDVDRKGCLRFAALQSPAADRLLGPVETRNLPDSIIVVRDGQPLVRSDAVLAMCRELGGLWRLAAISRVLPRRLRDYLYAWVAKRRYALFGTLPTCRLPTPAQRGRFLV